MRQLVRVALLDPGSEGLVLAATLRAAGFDVDLLGLESITVLIADVLVLAGDAPNALAALRALRDDGMRPDTPVVLVGAPQGMPIAVPGPAFGADWALSRDAVETDLAHAVRHVHLLAAQRKRAGRKSDAPGLREHTFELGPDQDEASRVSARRDDERAVADDASSEGESGVREPPSGEIEVGRKLRSSDPAPRSQDFSDASSVEIAFDAVVSPALAELLLAADRRVFPHLPPTDPSLPRGEARARDLVPESLLFSSGAEPEEEPALDSLTFVGAVPEVRPEPLPRTSPGLSAPARTVGALESEPPPAITPAARRLSERPRIVVGDPRRPPTQPGLPTPTRAPTEPKERSQQEPPREVTGDGDLMAWVRALRERLVTGVTSISLEAPPLRAIVTVKDGQVLDFEADLEHRVLALLDGVAPARDATSEREAAVELARRREGGLLTAYRESRLRAEARRACLAELLAAPTVHFRIGAGRDAQAASRPFSRRLVPLLVEVGATVIDRARAVALLGGSEAALTQPTGAYAVLSRAAELAPELDTILSVRGSLGELLDAGWEEPSLPAALVVLGALGALEVRVEGASLGAAGSASHGRAHQVKAWLEAVSARVEDADYFALLELPREASPADVARAHGALSARLEALHLPSLELTHLEPQRLSALRAIDEAYRVLRVERWASAYRRALAT